MLHMRYDGEFFGILGGENSWDCLEKRTFFGVTLPHTDYIVPTACHRRNNRQKRYLGDELIKVFFTWNLYDLGFIEQYKECKKNSLQSYKIDTISTREWRLEMFGTAMVGCLLVVSATIALFILFRFK